MSMKKLDIALLIGLVAAIVIGNFTAFADNCEDLRGSVLRLHILANTNSEEDQQLKYAVRDKLIESSAELFPAGETRYAVELSANEQLDEIQAMAQQVVNEKGYDYQVHAELVNMYFETRVYEDDTMPAGYYDAVRITIGAAAGKNWWCVLYPPLCLPAASKSDGVKVNADGEAFFTDSQLKVLKSSSKYEAKFAIVELIEKLKRQFGSK